MDTDETAHAERRVADLTAGRCPTCHGEARIGASVRWPCDDCAGTGTADGYRAEVDARGPEDEPDAEEPGHPSTKSARAWADIVRCWHDLRHTDPAIDESLVAIERELAGIADVPVTIDDGFAQMLLAHGWDVD